MEKSGAPWWPKGSAGKSQPLHKMQFGSLSSPAQQTLSTTGHKPGTVCFPYTCANVGYVPNQSPKPHTSAHKKANCPFACSHLEFPALQANLGIGLIMLEMTSNTHTALLSHKQRRIWCKFMCSKTHFPHPDSLWKDPLPSQPPGCRAHVVARTQRRGGHGAVSHRHTPAPSRAVRSPGTQSSTVS